MHNHAQTTHAPVTEDQLVDLIQYAFAVGADIGCTEQDAHEIIRAWQVNA